MILLNILFIAADIAYCVILNADIYTDRFTLPDGILRKLEVSPAHRLFSADMPLLLYLAYVLAAVSAAAAILFLAGVRNKAVRTASVVCFILSTLAFAAAMAVSAGIHVHY